MSLTKEQKCILCRNANITNLRNSEAIRRINSKSIKKELFLLMEVYNLNNDISRTTSLIGTEQIKRFGLIENEMHKVARKEVKLFNSLTTSLTTVGLKINQRILQRGVSVAGENLDTLITTSKKKLTIALTNIALTNNVNDEKLVNDAFMGYQKNLVFRNDLFARQTATVSLSLIKKQIYKESGIVDMNEWQTSLDGRVRSSHIQNEGIVLPIDTGVFPSGESYPGQNSFNCRCILVPVFKR